MKLKSLLSLTMGLCLALSACTSEDFTNKTLTDGEATVSFSVNIPKTIQSRAFSDGSQATSVYAILYRTTNNGDEFVKTITTTYNSGATIETRLVKDQAYKIVFWAQKGSNAISADGKSAGTPGEGEAPYTIDPQTGVVSMNYGEAPVGNDESRDAFAAEYTISKVTEDVSVEVELTRPFSQLNFAASDFDSAKEAGVEYTKAAVTVDAYPSLNLISGAATGNLTSVTFASTAFPATETFPNSDTSDETEYKYLSMNYFLVYQDASSTLDKAVLTLANDNEWQSFEYTNVPVQKNYRTNVYGALLTNDYKISLSLNAAYKGAYSKFTEVSTAAELTKALAAGESVTLTDDISVSTLSVSSASTEEEPVQIALAGKTLTVQNMSTISGDVTVNGAAASSSRAEDVVRGKIVVTGLAANTNPAFMVSSTGSLRMENVDLETNGYGVYVASNGAKLVVNNSKITCTTSGSGIGTNASTPYSAEITVTNSEMHGYCGLFLNVPINATIENCDLYGVCNGAMLRGGTYNIKNTRFYLDLPAREKVLVNANLTLDPNVVTGNDRNLEEKVWGSGTSVPISAICIGNRAATNATSTSSYMYPSIFNGTLEDSYALIIPPTETESILDFDLYSNIYIYANPDIDGVKNGVYFNFDESKLPKLTNETYTKASTRGIVYGSANIFTLVGNSLAEHSYTAPAK